MYSYNLLQRPKWTFDVGLHGKPKSCLKLRVSPLFQQFPTHMTVTFPTSSTTNTQMI
jgi:hypothetical protein